MSNERLAELIDIGQSNIGKFEQENIERMQVDALAALRELIELRALVLASRPALEFGAYCIERHTYLDNHVDAAQLRTLSAYGVGK